VNEKRATVRILFYVSMIVSRIVGADDESRGRKHASFASFRIMGWRQMDSAESTIQPADGVSRAGGRCDAGAIRNRLFRQLCLKTVIFLCHNGEMSSSGRSFNPERPDAIVHADSIGKACKLLERLTELFSPERVDYEFACGSNRFLVLSGTDWRVVTFSDSRLLRCPLEELEADILRFVEDTAGRDTSGSTPSIRHG